MANLVKLNGVRPEVIKLHLFPFSLRDIAATWYESLPYGSVDTWEELVEAFLGRFFLPSFTTERRREIIVFQQGEEESLYTAWERYKRLLKRCPMHGIDLKTQMDIVYHSLNDTSKGIIDASCCGAFKRKSVEEARDLIADLAKCNMKAPSKFTRSYNKAREGGVIELNKMIAMEAKLDAIMHRMDKQDKKLHSAHEIGAVERIGIRRSAEGSANEDPNVVEKANYLNEQRSYHFKPNPNLPTHYNLALRNHENFSYGGGSSQGQRQGKNYQQGYHPPRFQQQGEQINEYQGQKRTQSFEEQMLQFIGGNKRLLHTHEQKFVELEALKSNSQMFQSNTNAYLKNLETQVGQLALTLQNQNKNVFPSDTQKNPKDCMAIQLRSGREMSNNRAGEKEKTDKKEEKATGGDNEKSKAESVATPEPGSTRMASPNRNPGTLDLFLLFYVLLNFLFQKCRDPNPRPDPNGGSEPEPGLLRCFHLSYQNILLIHLVAEAVSGLSKPIIIYKFKAIR